MRTIKVSLQYPLNSITTPLVSNLVRRFNVEVNILHANISLNKIGTLIADITGEDKDIEDTLEYIVKQDGIRYKLFNNKLIWQEEDCVHCGACTAVCPSNALTMNKETWCLEFSKEKCLVCGLCAKACPLNVMSLQA